MKKFLYVLLIAFCLPFTVSAKNNIYTIDMEIYLNEDGSANITEKWNVKGSDGTEWYKVINGINKEDLNNFQVTMDNTPLIYKNWNVDESLKDKKGYYGINYTDVGLELCFGKYDYNNHIFTLKYDINDFIAKTDDSDVLYWNLIDKLSDVEFDKFNVVVSGFYDFPDTLDVWGYGYKGYAYVKDNKIFMSNEENTDMNGSYAVLLAKFPLNTFSNNKTMEGVTTFEDVQNMAQEGSFIYDYDNNKPSFIYRFFRFLIIAIGFVVPFIAFIFVTKSALKNSYGYRNNKTINKKEVPNFRDIPCNKDIYYANALISLNKFSYKESNIFGAIILKWIKEDKIKFINNTKGVFNKETTSIDLRNKPKFDKVYEQTVFDMMYEASKDGILESKELEKWARKNYKEFFDIFKDLSETKILELKQEGHIYERKNKEECKFVNVMDDILYEESVKLYGLKKFLVEFSGIKTKTAIEVKLWDEYLMFAYLFGIADKVAKQFKNLYPEIISEMENVNYDYSTVIFIHDISTSSFNAASSARSAAEDYTAGGGGFSFGGGGGGSFGGGGGGSR